MAAPTAHQLDVLRSAQARSADIEAARRLPADLSHDLIEAGLLRLFVAEAYGGPQMPLIDGFALMEQAAYHDGGAGWCVMIASTTSLLSGSLPADHAATIYGPPGAVTGGLAAPMGTAEVVDGGLEVSGRWAWGSGIFHCTHVGGGVRQGSDVPLFVYFDMDDVEIFDTWHSAGLRGSGSTDYAVDRAFVPEGRWVRLVGRTPVIDAPQYRFSENGALAMGVAYVMIGLGRRALDEVRLLSEKQPAGSTRTLGERPAVQAEYARATAALRAARLQLDHVVGVCTDWLIDNATATDEQRVDIRLATSHAAEVAVDVATTCFRLGGGTAVYESSPLQRILRDANVAAQHAITAPRVFEPLGRSLFGLDTDTSML